MGEDAENICSSTGLNLLEEKAPVGYILGQNYPNPFNPSTEISYNLPEKTFVSLKVYDALGKKIVTLVNENKPSGVYSINFNGAGLGSGVYFYQLKTEKFAGKRKMILIK